MLALLTEKYQYAYFLSQEVHRYRWKIKQIVKPKIQGRIWHTCYKSTRRFRKEELVHLDKDMEEIGL